MVERILWVVAVLTVGGAAFFGGQQVGRQAGMQARAQAQQQFFAQRGGGQAGLGPGAGAAAGPGAAGGATGQAGAAGPAAPGGGQPVLGTVARVEGEQIVLTTADGAELTVTLAEGGTLRRQVEGRLSDLAVGEQVVAFGTREGDTIEARSIQIGGFGRGDGAAPPAP